MGVSPLRATIFCTGEPNFSQCLCEPHMAVHFALAFCGRRQRWQQTFVQLGSNAKYSLLSDANSVQLFHNGKLREGGANSTMVELLQPPVLPLSPKLSRVRLSIGRDAVRGSDVAHFLERLLLDFVETSQFTGRRRKAGVG